jgi:hypothetical protein
MQRLAFIGPCRAPDFFMTLGQWPHICRGRMRAFAVRLVLPALPAGTVFSIPTELVAQRAFPG